MSAVQETIEAKVVERSVPILNRVINFLSSVRVGVIQLCILVALSMIGMLVIQQNVQGFDTYYASLTPAEKLVFGKLGFFDIYYSWYFKFLLVSLSLNIVLSSIERFPSAWAYIKSPKRTASRDFLLNQKDNDVIVSAEREQAVIDKVTEAFQANGLSPTVTRSESTSYALDENGKKNFDQTITKESVNIFAEKGKYNRMGAYIVHVALLLLFLGHFVALQTGFDADVRMIPGDATDKIQMIEYDLDRKEKFDVQLPFTMTCTDIQQKLLDPSGSIDVTNTLDWRTQLRVDDPEYGTTIADISMNKPFSYRGYRFFQAQTIPVGNARSIMLELTPEDGGAAQNITIPRMGSTSLSDGTLVEYDEFLPDFAFNAEGRPDTRSGDYNNPAAVLNVTPPGGERTRVFAFGPGVAANIPVAAPKLGYKWSLKEYEKSPFAHVLSIKYDPYEGAFIAWYIGGFGLIGALAFVFFFSHRRYWALVEKTDEGDTEIVMGAHSNRNPIGLEEKFGKLKADIDGRLAS